MSRATDLDLAASRLADRLHARVFATIFPCLAQGLLADRRRHLGHQAGPTEGELTELFEASLTVLFRLLVLLHAEGQSLLPIQEAVYRDASLTRIKEEIAARAGTSEALRCKRLEQAYSPTAATLDDRLQLLFRALDGGAPTLNVCAWPGGLFRTTASLTGQDKNGSACLLLAHKVPDRFLALAIDGLAREQNGGSLGLEFIDYQSLDVRHLGTIYEELLEITFEVVEGNVSLSRSKVGRKASGSYYTPRPIIEYIVTHTVGPILDAKLETLRREFHNTAGTSNADILERYVNLTVLDPAMGTGHFLIEAVHFIAERLREFLSRTCTGIPDIHFLKRHVLTSCIFGMDINPMAVALAKVALWLDNGDPDVPLRFLDHLRCGNSLVEDQPERGRAEFDVVLGNPPYDVLAEKELQTDLKDLLGYFRREKVFGPARGGKLNLYKLFLCRGVELLRKNGRLGYIVPMSLLGDQQAAGVRKMLLDSISLTAVEAFPQKDDRRKRVFAGAKLSTCVFIASKSGQGDEFRCRVHPGKVIEAHSPSLLLRSSDVKRYDPENQPIVTCDQEDWDLAVRILSNGRMKRLREFCTAYQGEVNETTDGQKGRLSESPIGPQILRGANVSLYALREASQGQILFLNKDRYLTGKGSTSRAWHFRQDRVGFQRNAPQNNFRRLIACSIPVGHFCCDTVSYFPELESRLALPTILALFNSKLLEWFFRLGSTNSKVNDYQVRILPVPAFDLTATRQPKLDGFTALLDDLRLEEAFQWVSPHLERPPFPAVVQACLALLARRIEDVEGGRGAIARRERSTLDRAAQPYQDLLDRIIYRLAGLHEDEVAGLERRLAQML